METSSRPPIFVLGNPRSGTTLLRLMLTCHGEIVVPPECGFAVWFYDRYRNWTPARSETFVAELMGAKKFDTWGLDEHQVLAAMTARQPATYADAVAQVYEVYAHHIGRSFSRWGDKNNFHTDHIATLDALFPQAFFVHIVRDGRNVACSYKQLHTAALDSRFAPRLPWQIADIADEWRTNNDRVDSVLSTLDSARSHRVRFEDLVSDTENTLRELCAALGEDFDPAMLDYHRRNARQELEPAELMAWKQKTLQPPIAAEIDRFRRELSHAEVAEFEGIAGDLLTRHGYQVSHD